VIYLLLEKVIGCSQIPVDCLKASKLVPLVYKSPCKLTDYLYKQKQAFLQTLYVYDLQPLHIKRVYEYLALRLYD